MMQSGGSQVERDGIWLWARKVAMVFTSLDKSCVELNEAIFGFRWRGPAMLCFVCKVDDGRV
jgi:hypothetical protein